MTVAELGEFGLIAAIRELLPREPAPLLGAGDDAAVVSAPDGRVVATTDLLVEGRHFRREWSSARDVGVKAAAQNLADVAAMGATATALLIGIATPGDLPVAWALDLMRGVAAECARAGAAVAGGDVTGADTLMLGVTALGDLAGAAPVTRSGARPGDILAVAGHLGWSAAGLALLTAGAADAGPELAAAHRRPQPPYHAGPQAARLGATAMIDISDGLLQDLGHVAAASGVSIDIDPARLPGTAPLRAAARRLRADWQDWALAGGEDHALAATFPAGTELPAGWTALGEVRAGSGVLVGSRPRGGPGGWNHFGGGAQELSAGTPAKSRTGVADLPPA
ncbi:MAG TPA: thiamine-phosphate kinase [Streptosporangiaceae bacterium]|nr:thiamine-phosphate kinase [Streptosporangiaceae bacterium]